MSYLASAPAAQVPYVTVLLWTTGASIVASIAGRVLIETATPSVIYLGFVLWAVAGSVLRLLAYRRGLSPAR